MQPGQAWSFATNYPMIWCSTQEISIWEKQQDSLKAYKLKHSYYNMTEQGSTTLQLDFKTP
jgi:hypothetical protein